MLNKLKTIFANKTNSEIIQQEIPAITTDNSFAPAEEKISNPPKKVRKSPTKKSLESKTRTKKSPEKKLSPKEIATNKREPYVVILNVELDPSNIGNGAFELDWNEFFIAKLVRAGYKGADDAQIVDQWFQDVCRNVVLETFEQFEANNPRPLSGVQRRDLGSGRTEVS